MRLPVRLADGSHFRIDMSPVVNAVETLILAAPPDVIATTLQNSLPGGLTPRLPGLLAPYGLSAAKPSLDVQCWRLQDCSLPEE